MHKNVLREKCLLRKYKVTQLLSWELLNEIILNIERKLSEKYYVQKYIKIKVSNRKVFCINRN